MLYRRRITGSARTADHATQTNVRGARATAKHESYNSDVDRRMLAEHVFL
jgi:hypothetical protein